MEFKLTRLGGNFGGEVTDIELPSLSDTGLRELLLALYAHRFLTIRTGGLDKAELVAFARRLGRPILYDKDAEYPEIIPITNVAIDTASGRKGAAHWHTDQSFRKEVASATMLYSVSKRVARSTFDGCVSRDPAETRRRRPGTRSCARRPPAPRRCPWPGPGRSRRPGRARRPADR